MSKKITAGITKLSAGDEIVVTVDGTAIHFDPEQGCDFHYDCQFQLTYKMVEIERDGAVVPVFIAAQVKT